MTKRHFLAVATGGISLFAASVVVEQSEIRTAYRKLKARLRTNRGPELPVAQRFAELPAEGDRISIEAALNSRCSSDHDGDPDVFHWGMFNPAARLSAEQIRSIAALADRCKLSSNGARIEIAAEALTFLAARTAPHDITMVESGMQQQAVCLSCAALGVGLTFESLGLDGIEEPSGDRAVVRMRLGAMMPSYGGSFWTKATPENERSWLSGNLPDPRRDGPMPLVSALEALQCGPRDGSPATRRTVSQLLWAARGRTPHLYKSRPWGLTIPTWQGRQDITTVYTATPDGMYRYSNWHRGRPSHSLEPIAADPVLCRRLREVFPPWSAFIILSTSDPYARGLWEIGYQLLNVLIQALGLGIACRPILPQDEQRAALGVLPIDKPIAIVGLRADAGPAAT